MQAFVLAVAMLASAAEPASIADSTAATASGAATAAIPPDAGSTTVSVPAAPIGTAPAPQTAGAEPWYRLTPGNKIGVGLDVGFPGGAGLVGLFRPWWWLRANAGFSYNMRGFGMRGGVTAMPLRGSVAPSLSLDYGHFFSGGASKFASNPSDAALLSNVRYDFFTAQLGLEFRSQQRFTWYLRGGLGYIGGTSIPAKDFQNKIQSSSSTGTFGATAPLEFRALLPCFSFGFDFFVL